MLNWNDVSKLPGIIFSRTLHFIIGRAFYKIRLRFLRRRKFWNCGQTDMNMEFHVEYDLLIIACMSGEFRCRLNH